MDFIIEYWLECIFSGLIAVLGLAVRLVCVRLKRLAYVEHGLQALLKDRIIQAYNHIIKQGYCPIYALENISEMYEQYHLLGGNGTVTRLVEELKQLPTLPQVKKEKEE
ncbi:MAG: hypothetical protein RR911_05590 [Oscillospiraceae bacterium]